MKKEQWTADDLGCTFDNYAEAVAAEKEFFYNQASRDTVINYLANEMDIYTLLDWAIDQPDFFNKYIDDYTNAAEAYAADWVSSDDL